MDSRMIAAGLAAQIVATPDERRALKAFNIAQHAATHGQALEAIQRAGLAQDSASADELIQHGEGIAGHVALA